MPSIGSAFRVFIASPGGLDAEREAVRDELKKFNEKFMHELYVAFSSQGWEDVPGGAGRPQQLINELVERCDYMILILSSRWGTKPAADGRSSSGTEEEFYLAQDCIAREDSPMTDILVLFKGVPEDQLSDPGDQLRRVIEFKQRLEESRTLLYKTFDDLEGLCREVGNRVLAWARGQGRRAPRPKEGRPLVPPDSTTNSSEHVEPAGAPALAAAEEYEAKGLMTQAEAAYARAIVDSDAASLEKYARFLRRTGRRTARLRRPPPRPAPPRARRSGRAMVTAAQPRRAPSSTPRPAAGTPGRRGPPADAARRGTVSCVATHRQVTGSMANTSRLWVSCSP